MTGETETAGELFSETMNAFYKDTRVLVTGAAGTVGTEIVRQLVELGADHVIGIDINESDIYHRSVQFADSPVTFALADVRDAKSLDRWTDGIDYIFHAAALKHVPVCEAVPSEAVRTNIEGTTNVIEAAQRAGVKKVLYTSTDKAVNPTNVMGTSKLMGERLMTAAAGHPSPAGTIFTSTRFGNVLGSRGSVVPIFAEQIASGGPLTLTDRNMTRFIMTLAEAVQLVLQSLLLAEGGEIFVTKMPVASIEDLANVMINDLGHGADIEISVTGPRAGEKLYEELMNEEEVRRSVELDDFIVVLPALMDEGAFGFAKDAPPARQFNSMLQERVSTKELSEYFRKNSVYADL